METDDTRFMRRQRATANLSKSHRRAPKQEKEVAKRVGGRRVSGSGSGQEKGDVRLKGVARIECKTTKHRSFSVTQDMLDKIEDAAMLAGELPIMVIEFVDDDGRKIRDAVVCPSYVLDSLTEAK